MITVSVPGKIHLMGEHAVVYGYPALLSAINLRMRVSIEPAKTSTSGVEIHSREPTDYARYGVNFLLEKLGISPSPASVLTITSDIPAGYHLGSSAALAVGITGAVLYFYKKIWNPIRINELAYEIEKKQHGNPSGGDNTAVTMGGLIWYRKELEFLRSIWQLPYKPHTSLKEFTLINTGRPVESTGEMVGIVSKKYTAQSERYNRIFHINELQTKRIATALKEGNESELIDAMRVGGKTLIDMGVVSDRIRPCIDVIESSGGAAKILGGGGKVGGVGYMLCYHPDPERIPSLISPFHFSAEHITLGEEGVRLDEK